MVYNTRTIFFVSLLVASSIYSVVSQEKNVVVHSQHVLPKTSEPSLPQNAAENERFNFSWDRFLTGFSASLYVIIISELGDKTFFIVAIMSMKHHRCLVYTGAMAALITMTILSACLGFATTVVPRSVTFYTSGVLFLIFGLKMLKDAHSMSPDATEGEFIEVEQKLSSADLEAGNVGKGTSTRSCGTSARMALVRCCSPVLAEAFILNFLAEWGDRSQLTTIVLAATKDTLGVIIGGVLGHAICCGLAVLMGRLVAQKIPTKWITYFGGATFILFAVLTFLGNPDSNS